MDSWIPRVGIGTGADPIGDAGRCLADIVCTVLASQTMSTNIVAKISEPSEYDGHGSSRRAASPSLRRALSVVVSVLMVAGLLGPAGAAAAVAADGSSGSSGSSVVGGAQSRVVFVDGEGAEASSVPVSGVGVSEVTVLLGNVGSVPSSSVPSLRVSVPVGFAIASVSSLSSLTKQSVGQWVCDAKVGLANCTLESADGSGDVVTVAPASFLATVIGLRASGLSAASAGGGVRLGVEFSLGDTPVAGSVGLVVSQGSPAGSSGSVNSGAGSGVSAGSSNVPVTSVVSQPGLQGPLSVTMTTDGSTTFTQDTDRVVVVDHATQYPIPGGVADDVVLPDGLSTSGVSSDGWVCPAGTGTIRCEHGAAISAAGSRLSIPVHVAGDAPLGFALGAVGSKSLDGVLAHQAILSLTIASVTGSTAPPADPISSGFTVSPALVAGGPVSVATLTVHNTGAATTSAPVTTLKIPASLVATSDDPACVVTDGFENTTTVVCTAAAPLAAGTEATPAASAPMVFHLAVGDDTTATTAAVMSHVTVDGRSTKDTAAGLPIAPAVVHTESIPTARAIPQVYAASLLDAPVQAMAVAGAPTGVTATSNANAQSVVS